MATVLGLTVGVGFYAGMSMITPLAWLRVLVAVVACVFFAIFVARSAHVGPSGTGSSPAIRQEDTGPDGTV